MISIQSDGKPKYEPSDSAEGEGCNRAIQNLEHFDPTEPETGALFYLYGLPPDTGTIADHNWSVRDIFKNKKTDFPVLIFMGEKAPWTPMSDMNSVAGVFKKAVVVRMKNSAELPFISETGLFTKSVEDFFRPTLLALKKKKGKENEKDKENEKEREKGRPSGGAK